MKQYFAGAALLVAMAGGVNAEPAAGLWKTEPGDTGGFLHVTIAPCGAAVCGTITQAFDENGAAVSDYEHQGKRLIWDMQPNGAGSYSSGKVWAPDTDKTYRSKMSLSGNTLTVKGCVAGGLICRGQNWKRLK